MIKNFESEAFQSYLFHQGTNFAAYEYLGAHEIYEEESPIKHGNSCQVGPTRGECLPPAIGRAHVQHGCYDEGIGTENH